MLKSFLTFFYLSMYSLVIFTPHRTFMIVSFNAIKNGKWTKGVTAIGCILTLTLGCVRKPSAVNIPETLKTTWLSYLKTQPNYDSTKIRFEVQNVEYFADTVYI